MIACENKNLNALELSSDIKTFYCFCYDLETLRCRYTKTTCWISFKLTVFNNETFSFQNINFLRD